MKTNLTAKPRFQSTAIPSWKNSGLKSSRPGGNRHGAGRERADAFGPESPGTNFATPEPGIVNDGMGNYHEALRTSKDRSQIPYALVHLRPQLLRLLNGLNRKMLSAIARYLVDNASTAAYVVNQIADYCVPVTPRSQCDDPEDRKKFNTYWDEWCKRCDFTRRYDMEQMQRIKCIAMDADGDIGTSITDEFGFPQIRLWDTFHIGKLTGLDPKDGVVNDDNNGVLQGYNVCDGSVETITGAALKFIPREQFFLLYDVERYNNYRGFSAFRHGSNDQRDKKDLLAFLKLKEKLGAALAGVIQSRNMLEEDVWGDDTGDDNGQGGNQPLPGASKFEKKLTLAELLGGDIPVIDGEIKQFVAAQMSKASLDFLDTLDGQFVMGLGYPPAFFLDEKLTGPNVRSVLGKIQRKFNNRKAAMARWVEWVWLRVIAWAIAHGELPAIKGWQKISFQFTPISTIDLGDMNANERADVLVGQMSETTRYVNRGQDFEHEHAQITEEIAIKLREVKQLATEFSDDPDEQKMIIPAILSRFGLVGPVNTRLMVQEGDDEQEKTNQKNQSEEKPGKKKTEEKQ